MNDVTTPVVVVADDQAESRELVATLLRYRNYRILEAADGVEALALLEREHADLLITDILMPRMDGFELAQRVRQREHDASLPIVFYTASYHCDQAARLAALCGVAETIFKPVEPPTVYAAIDRALATGRTLAAAALTGADFAERHAAVVRDKVADQARRLAAGRQRLFELAKLGQMLALASNPADVAWLFCASAREILLAGKVGVLMIERGGELTLSMCCGDRSDARRLPHPVPPELTQAGPIPGGILDAEATASVVKAAGVPFEGAVATVIATPLAHHGWLCVERPVGGSPSDFDEATLLTMAAQLAAAFENAQQRAQLRARTALLANESAARAIVEQDLRAADESFRALFDSVSDGMLQARRDGTILRVNPALVGILGYESAEELLGVNAGTLYESARCAERLAEQLERFGCVQDAAVNLRRKDGSVVSGLLSAHAVQGRDASGDYHEVTYRDLTEHNRRASAHRRMEEQRLFAMRAARLGVWQYDPASGALEWGDTMSEVYGVPPAQFPSTFAEFLTRIHPEDREHVTTVLSGTPSSESLAALEFRTVWPDGTTHWVRGAGQPAEGRDGGPRVLIGVAIDVTDRKRLEEQFHHAQKIEAVGQLAGGVAHDFNNLLTAIIGFTELVEDGLEPASPVRADLAEVINVAHRAADLTRQLLAFSRRQVLQPTVLDINELLSAIQPMLRRLMREDVELVVDPAPHLQRVMADAGQVEQVVLNLAVNARDAMPNGGMLRITTGTRTLDDAFVQRHPGSRSGQHVMVSVSDNGVGMSPATQSRMFEPFFTTKDVHKGTGLGLSTVYGIVKQSGGYIDVESQLGQGSRFTVYLPALTESTAVAAPAAPPRAADSVSGAETLLLVEDEDAVRTLASRVLERHGYRVLAASDALTALTLATTFPGHIDLVISDVVLPAGSGPEVFEHLARRRPGLKLLFISGYARDAFGANGVVDERTPFLQKPFSSEELLRQVRGVLDGTRPGRSIFVAPL